MQRSAACSGQCHHGRAGSARYRPHRYALYRAETLGGDTECRRTLKMVSGFRCQVSAKTGSKTVKKKFSCLALGAMLFAFSSVEAQQLAKMPRIGYLAPLSPASESARTGAFSQGLRDLDYIEGKNIVVEYRYAEGNN